MSIAHIIYIKRYTNVLFSLSLLTTNVHAELRDERVLFGSFKPTFMQLKYVIIELDSAFPHSVDDTVTRSFICSLDNFCNKIFNTILVHFCAV